MANLKEIRGRITSISSTMQITSAMKMVSAAKLKKATDAITMLRPYSEKLTELIENVSNGANLEEVGTYTVQREVKKVLYVVITSNRGLAGAFNSSVIKVINNDIAENADKNIEILSIGKKGFDVLRKSRTIFGNESDVYDHMSFGAISKITERIMLDYREGAYDQVFVFYNKFVNAATQEVQKEQVLPISLPEKNAGVNTDYIFEPSSKEILENLIPKAIKTQIYKAVIDSIASEHGARMTAMHKATDNAQDLKNDLVIFYNKARQAAITGEILEIVGGAEALKDS